MARLFYMAEDVDDSVRKEAWRKQRLHHVGDSYTVEQRNDERILAHNRRDDAAGFLEAVSFAGNYDGVHHAEAAGAFGGLFRPDGEIAEQRGFYMQAAAVYGFKRFAARYKICIFILSRQRAADQTAYSAIPKQLFSSSRPPIILLPSCRGSYYKPPRINKKSGGFFTVGL